MRGKHGSGVAIMNEPWALFLASLATTVFGVMGPCWPSRLQEGRLSVLSGADNLLPIPLGTL